MGRVAVDFGVGQGAKRSADIRSDLGQASNPERFRGQNQRNPSGREQKGSWPRTLSGLAAPRIHGSKKAEKKLVICSTIQ